MSEKDNGGPAFPHVWTDNGMLTVVCGGMTLRDYFAAKAVAGLITSSKKLVVDGAQVDEITVEIYARRAYDIADAMLAERGKQ